MTKSKNAITIGAGLLGVTGAALLGTGHAHATTTTATVKYNQGATTVWTSPEVGQQVKRYVFKNQSFNVLAKKTIGATTWYQVGQDEWINGKYVSVSTNNTNIVLTPDYADGAVTVWATPAYTQPTGQYLTDNQQVNAVAKHVVGHETWYQLDNGGWVPARYVKVVNGVTHVAPLQPATQQHSVVLHSSITTKATTNANVTSQAFQTTSAVQKTTTVTSQALHSAVSANNQQATTKVTSAVASQTAQSAAVSTAPKQVVISATNKTSQAASTATSVTATKQTQTTNAANGIAPASYIASQASQTSVASTASQTTTQSKASQQVVVSATNKTSQVAQSAASTAKPAVSVASQHVVSQAAASQAPASVANKTSQAAQSTATSTAKPATSAASQHQQSQAQVTNSSSQAATTTQTNTNAAAAVIKCAEEQLGKPYVTGGKGPNGFDCSGLMHYVFLHGANKEIGGWTVPQESAGTHISVADAQPGDLLFWGTPGNTYHDALYIGNGEYIAAPKPGDVVDVEHISSYFMPSFAVRVL